MVSPKILAPLRRLFEINQLVDRSELKEAVNELLGLIDEYPNFGPSYNLLGYLYGNHFNDPRQAIPCYEKAVELDPEYAPTYFNYLIALNSVGAFDIVPSIAEKASSVKGIDNGKINYCLGMMYELKNDIQEAAQAYRLAITSSVNSQEIVQYREALERCDLKSKLVA